MARRSLTPLDPRGLTAAVLAPSLPLTRDGLWNGALTLWQPARGHGYRFNLDPVLLAGFVRPGEHALDLGAGCGVIAVLLLAMGKVSRVTAVELQPELAELVRRNAEENGFADRLEVVCADLRSVELPRVDRVVFNPPYFRARGGRPAPVESRDAARHERHGTLADFVACAGRHLRPGGEAAAIIRAERHAELAQLWRGQGGALGRVREVRSRRAAPPKHVLVAASMEPLESQSEQPLVVHADQGRAFSPEVRELLRER